LATVVSVTIVSLFNSLPDCLLVSQLSLRLLFGLRTR
jgi:Ca2+/Na+ antiporter